MLIPFAAAVVIGLMVLWPGGAPAHERSGVGFDRQTQQGKVTALEQVDCKSVNASQVPPTANVSTPEGREARAAQTGECKKATIEVVSGPEKGRTFIEIVQPGAPRQLTDGQEVVVAYAPDAPRDLQYSVIDVNRKLPMAVLAGIFAVAVVLVGRMRGLFALIALGVSFAVLTLFILPAILQGSNPLVVAVVGASAIMLIALYMCHGLTARTSVAVLGTLVSLLLIGLLGSGFIDWAFLSGNTDDNTGLIHGLYPNIDMSGLLLAGVIIGSLGVLDDVTVTQTSAVWELRQADPSMGAPGPVPGGHPDRPRPHRVGGQHAGPGLRGRGAAAAAALLHRQQQRGLGGQQRAGRGGDRTDARGLDRPGGLGPGNDGPGRAGGLGRPAGIPGRRTGLGTGPRRPGPAAQALTRAHPLQPAFCSFCSFCRDWARILQSASSRLSSKSPRLRS
ncbi:hypothetical protein GCM10020254_44280 [Streptomyces goshikiensis]